MAQTKPDAPDRLAQGKAWIEQNKDESADALRDGMHQTGQQFLAELEGLTPAQQEFSPGEDQWSIKETCLHVVHAISRVGKLVPRLAEGTPPDGPKPKMGVLAEDPGHFDQVIEQLKDTFALAADAAASLEGSPNLDVTGEHPLFGPLNCREWMAFNIMHLKVHVRQVQRIKSAEGFPSAKT